MGERHFRIQRYKFQPNHNFMGINRLSMAANVAQFNYEYRQWIISAEVALTVDAYSRRLIAVIARKTTKKPMQPSCNRSTTSMFDNCHVIVSYHEGVYLLVVVEHNKLIYSQTLMHRDWQRWSREFVWRHIFVSTYKSSSSHSLSSRTLLLSAAANASTSRVAILSRMLSLHRFDRGREARVLYCVL